MTNRFATGRHAGLLVPLFSMPSTRSWGIGEIGDLATFAAWLDAAGQDLVQILPVNEMAPGQRSPYSALTAMAIDPIYISVYAVDEFAALGGEAAAPAGFRAALAMARAAPGVDYGTVRALKMKALRAAFDRFHDAEWRAMTPRAEAMRAYVDAEDWWIEDFSLFRALLERAGGDSWLTWRQGLRARRSGSLARARRELAREILFQQYLQWIAGTQWQEARAAAGRVGIFGDLPFMVGVDSADVWARQDEFRLDASVGVPPDAFSETGQDWGLPVYRWDVLRAREFDWLRDRAWRGATLFDGYRVDHLVGFYRTYVRPRDGAEPYFTPETEDEQVALGETVLGIFRDADAFVIAEDLGTVPDFVRVSLGRLGIPGYRVLRWEREWEIEGQPFRDPSTYPPASVATSGTHDTDPLACWWDEAPIDERQQVSELPTLQAAGLRDPEAAFSPAVRDTLVAALYGSGSDFVILPIQDVFGWRDRINVPATVDDSNWTYRLPWPVDALASQPEARERAAALRELSRAHRRGATTG